MVSRQVILTLSIIWYTTWGEKLEDEQLRFHVQNRQQSKFSGSRLRSNYAFHMSLAYCVQFCFL